MPERNILTPRHSHDVSGDYSKPLHNKNKSISFDVEMDSPIAQLKNKPSPPKILKKKPQNVDDIVVGPSNNNYGNIFDPQNLIEE